MRGVWIAARLCAAVVAVVLAHGSRATDIDWLYEVDVPVADQSADERTRGIRAAFATLLTRVTGDIEVASRETVADALRAPERYFVGYAYRTPAPAQPGGVPTLPRATSTDAASLLLSVSFSPNAVRQLIDSANLPMWSRNRPSAIVWLAMDAGGERRVLGSADGQAIVAALTARAAERGVFVTLPAMDPEAMPEVATADVWNRRWDALEQASLGYDVQSLLVGRVTESSTGRWLADWTYRLGAGVQSAEPPNAMSATFAAEGSGGSPQREAHTTVETTTPELAAAAGVDLMVETLVTRYAIPAGQTADVVLQVDHVSDVGSYAAILGYLGKLDYVDAVQVDEITDESVKLRVHTRTPWPQLRELFAIDGQLEPGEAPSIETELDAAQRLIWRASAP